MGTVRRGGRRADIVRAAHRCIARRGFERATTAQICTEAGVSSGTFFHYFPTKTAVLVAVLQEGLDHAREVFRRIQDAAEDDAAGALGQWQEHVLAEAADEDLAGFAAALGSVREDPDVAAALRAETDLVQRVLTEVIAAGGRQGTMRRDVAPERVALWLGVVAEGLLNRAIEEGAPDDALPQEFDDVLARLVRP